MRIRDRVHQHAANLLLWLPTAALRSSKEHAPSTRHLVRHQLCGTALPHFSSRRLEPLVSERHWPHLEVRTAREGGGWALCQEDTIMSGGCDETMRDSIRGHEQGHEQVLVPSQFFSTHQYVIVLVQR